MESKAYIKAPTKKNRTGLLPHRFKMAGALLMVLAFVPPAVIGLTDTDLPAGRLELLKLLSRNTFLLGLLFIAWARDRVEDEMTLALRFKSLGMAFYCAVLYVILNPVTVALLGEPIVDVKAHEVIGSMLFFYLILYYVQKKGR